MTRQLPEKSAHLDELGDQSGHGGPDSGGQSGDTQGLSQTADAAEETVEELADAGQDYEAGIAEGSEDAADHPEAPVPRHDGQGQREDPSPGRGPA
jgi:hypothetical protein